MRRCRSSTGSSCPPVIATLLKPGGAPGRPRRRDASAAALLLRDRLVGRALATPLSAHFALWEFIDVDVREPALLRIFPRYVPVRGQHARRRARAVSLGSRRARAHHGQRRLPLAVARAVDRRGSPHCWGTAANIYRIGPDYLDTPQRIERYAAIARRVLPFSRIRPSGDAIAATDDHLHVDIGYVTVVPRRRIGARRRVKASDEYSAAARQIVLAPRRRVGLEAEFTLVVDDARRPPRGRVRRSARLHPRAADASRRHVVPPARTAPPSTSTPASSRSPRRRWSSSAAAWRARAARCGKRSRSCATSSIAGSGRSGRAARLAGFSTHYNMSLALADAARCRTRGSNRLARALTYVLPAPVMLLATNRRSTGVGVRPRRQPHRGHRRLHARSGADDRRRLADRRHRARRDGAGRRGRCRRSPAELPIIHGFTPMRAHLAPRLAGALGLLPAQPVRLPTSTRRSGRPRRAS